MSVRELIKETNGSGAEFYAGTTVLLLEFDLASFINYPSPLYQTISSEE